ncbi:receptor-transporting protein 4 [Microcebus murinus]|uniref:receptor-transporting protein 4 n=1 Tax=Microcebus murinus TaxID=30608 RepID=UPI003F6AF7F8
MIQPQKQRMGLDIGTWEQIFQELIQEVKPWAKWTLKLDGDLQLDCLAPGWKQHQQRAFGWFHCSLCCRSWASARVQILCHTYWERRMDQGQVVMRPFAQRCQKCTWSQYEMPEFSPESTTRILNNLVQHILTRYYQDGTRKPPNTSVIPEVTLEGSHDTANCEACALGFCLEGLQSHRTEPLPSPPSYLKIGTSFLGNSIVCIPKQAMKQSAQAKEAKASGSKGSVPSRAWDPLTICLFCLLVVALVLTGFKKES